MLNFEIQCVFAGKEKKKKLTAVIKIVIAVLLFGYFLSVKKLYAVDNDFFMKRFVLASCAFAVLIFLSVFKIKLDEKIDHIFSVILAAASPIYAWIVSEWIVNEAKCAVAPTDIFHKEPLWIAISLGSVLLVYLLLLFITNRIAAASLITSMLSIALGFAVFIVYELRGIPMMAPDMLTIKTATSVMDDYTIQLSYLQLMAIFAAVGLFYLILQLEHNKIFKTVSLRAAALTVMIICSAVFVNKMVYTDFMEKNKINIRMFRPMESYQKYGAAATFIRSIGYCIVDEPEGYSVAKVKEIISKYENETEKQKKKPKTPNIITIVNETFADIKVLGDFKTNQDYMPYYRSLVKGEDCVYGYTYASIVGGQTANTEFELLTGDTLGFLPQGTTAFQLYIHGDTPSLVSNLKLNGYTGNQALHPFNPYNYNRPAVYKYLGFNDFLSKFDFPENVERVREYISDKADIDRVISEYEKSRKNSDAPFFMYNMTIQNHSPYDQDWDNFKQPIQIEKSKYDDQANRYLNLIKYSDDSLKQIVEYFKQRKEPTVILFLGDHQPRLKDSFLNKITNGEYKNWSSEEMMKRYQVPFIIWANYDIEKQYINKSSMNYIQSIMLEAAGAKMTGFQKFLNKIREQVPTITANGYWGANGKFYQIEDKNSPYYDIINEYRILQYNMLFDTKNRVNSFFELGK